jgi:hypothetical protein
LRDDLGQAIPRADTPLDEIEHPLLVKAVGQFSGDETPHERIAAVDDQVLFKVKVQRWRGDPAPGLPHRARAAPPQGRPQPLPPELRTAADQVRAWMMMSW